MHGKQNMKMGNRWIELSQMTYSQHQSFMDDQFGLATVDFMDSINDENLNRCVRLGGLPYKATEQDIKDFFGEFSLGDEGVVLEVHHGKLTGNALVFLSNSDDVQRAKLNLDKQYIGNRYINVLVPRVRDD